MSQPSPSLSDLISPERLLLLVRQCARRRYLSDPASLLGDVYVALAERLIEQPERTTAVVRANDLRVRSLVDNILRSEQRRRATRRGRYRPLTDRDCRTVVAPRHVRPDQPSFARADVESTAQQIRETVSHPIHRLVVLLHLAPLGLQSSDLAEAVGASRTVVRSGKRHRQGVARECAALEGLLEDWKRQLVCGPGQVAVPDSDARRELAWILRGESACVDLAVWCDTAEGVAARLWLDKQYSRGRGAIRRALRPSAQRAA
jgi:hypothetical protein